MNPRLPAGLSVASVLAGSLALGWMFVPACAGLEYHVVELGTLGGTASEAHGLNDGGQVVGGSKDSEDKSQAFRWHNGVMTGLGFLPGGTNSTATAINHGGVVVGYAGTLTHQYHPFLWATNVMEDLGTLGGLSGRARGINDRQDVVGWAQLAGKSDPQMFFRRDGRMIHVPPYQGFLSCEANGVNQEGRLCGITFLYSPNPRWWACVWFDVNDNQADDAYEMKVLGSLAPRNSAGEYSGAMDINDLGQVVGWTGITNTFYPQQAFLVSPSNGQWKIPDSDINPTNSLMRSLGTLSGPTNNSFAYSINNSSWIVGTSSTDSGTNRAFLWREGVLHDLNDLILPAPGWTLTHATGINESHEICGYGLHHGQTRAFLLRREGRITFLEPVVQLETWITTNETGGASTEQVARVQGFLLGWGGVWGDPPKTTPQFTVESTLNLELHGWAAFAPTSQWPVTETTWTHDAAGDEPARFFRVNAQ